LLIEEAAAPFRSFKQQWKAKIGALAGIPLPRLR
jgi:hypothetical protein